MTAGARSTSDGLPLGGPSSHLPLLLGGAALATGSAFAAAALGPVALALPVAGAVAYLLLRYPLALYVAFLYIGLFKGQGVIERLPVDATLILGLLLGCVCLHRLLQNRVRLPPMLLSVPVVLIATLMAVSLLWTPEYAYGSDKTMKFATLTALATFAPFFLIEGRADLRRFLTLLAAIGVIGAFIVYVLGTTNGQDEGRLEFSGAANTIFTSRFLLTGAFVLLLAPALRLWKTWRPGIVVVGLAVIAVAVSIGSRGPVVAFVLAMACTILAISLREPGRIMPVLLLVAAGIAVLPLIPLPETSEERLNGLVENPQGTFNEDLRSRLYSKGVDLAEENSVRGIGAGGFFLYSYVVTNREERYPHNVFLEIAAELGIFPALLLAISIVVMLALLYRNAWIAGGDDRTISYLIAGVFLLNLFAAQFSGDFNDNKTFWALLGLGWLVARYGVDGRTVQGSGREVKESNQAAITNP